jgi:hypothetical protein
MNLIEFTSFIVTPQTSPSIIRVIKSRRLSWVGYVACVGERRSAHRVLVGKSEGKRPLDRPRVRCENNIKVYFREVGWGMDLIDLAQDRGRW